MHSSYNLIKEDRVENRDGMRIETEYFMPQDEALENDENLLTFKGITYEDAQNYIKNYENIGQNILIEARKRKDEYLVEMLQKAEIIEKEAYEKGYKQGSQNGYEDGKKEAFDSTIPIATKEAKELREEAENILNSARNDYEDYLNSKKTEILELALVIAENILNREIKEKDGINNLVDSALELSKGEENVIIKCNPKHEEQLKNEILIWKTTYNIKGEIFIIADKDIRLGNAIIKKNNGKIEVGIDIGLERIREVLLG